MRGAREGVVAVVARLGLAGAYGVGAAAPGLAGDVAPVVREACPGAAVTDRVAGFDPSGDIRLASGTAVRVVDLRMSDADGPAVTRRRLWLASLAGANVSLRALGPPDRWRRVPARLLLGQEAAGGAGGIDLAEVLVGEGWARVDAGERGALCRPELRATEDGARRRKAGLWAQSAEPLAAADLEALREADGRFVVVEGRVVGVGERRSRTYLDFGRDFAQSFSVSVPQRDWAAMKRAGLSAETLRGATVRVRGTIEIRRAPSMEIVAADMIEVLERPAGRTP